ncbi:MAG: iron-sulfur cluster assembly accessory protein [Gammaproteobacteria bacterium]|nr:iron-sulfur cluster assembly accessory protein [Gammaproteobacteria bacterium]MDE1887418.1 iron-sulfur cluster assembly accessory protein [Gammaproteobacteria bacterium]MDE2022811.1 iron-sulfur cluster assembly accessory protein [Gammaproteobacteria bacterium]
MAITLTDSAARRVQNYLEKRGGFALRLGVKKTGCSGFAYVVDYADTASPEDVVFEQHGVKVLVSRENLPLLDGTRVDFIRKGLNESFQFDNPNVKDACGCGESFTV